MDEAYVSLTTNNDYALGALVLGKSLRNTQTKRKLVLMVTTGVSTEQREQLNQYWDDLVDVSLLESNDQENLLLLSRPELGCTFSKLSAWKLIQFKKCVFLDADTLVVQNVDDLFEREQLSAAPDVGWPDCFNSGVFVFKPSQETYEALLRHASEKGSFDGGDQGLLNEFFHTWPYENIDRHLPFLYNMVSNVSYSYAPAFKRFGPEVKIVHFLGPVKPWHHHYDKKSGKITLLATSAAKSDHIFIQMWWDLLVSNERHAGTSDTSGASTASLPTSWQNWDVTRTQARTSSERKRDWERGYPDYCGEDSFEKILQYMGDIMLKRNQHPAPIPTTEIVTTIESQQTTMHSPQPALVTSITTNPQEEKSAEDMDDREQRRQLWERGEPDYTGQDNFDKVAKRIAQVVSDVNW